MNKSQQLWMRAAQLLADQAFFDSEREKVLVAYPSLNSHGLGQLRYRRRVQSSTNSRAASSEIKVVPDDLQKARKELCAGGRHENGIRNTLEYFVEARPPLGYHLKGCAWARRFNGPAPSRRSSYGHKHDVESYLRSLDQRRGRKANSASRPRYTANGAFVCAALMAGLRIWSYQGSINPDLRIGMPWAVAGLRPEDFNDPEDQRMAKFWRWAVQCDISDPIVKDFIAGTVELLYAGADLRRLHEALSSGCFAAQEVYKSLRHEFGVEKLGERPPQRLGFMAGEIEVPDDFNSMGGPEIAGMFGSLQ